MEPSRSVPVAIPSQPARPMAPAVTVVAVPAQPATLVGSFLEAFAPPVPPPATPPIAPQRIAYPPTAVRVVPNVFLRSNVPAGYATERAPPPPARRIHGNPPAPGRNVHGPGNTPPPAPRRTMHG